MLILPDAFSVETTILRLPRACHRAHGQVAPASWASLRKLAALSCADGTRPVTARVGFRHWLRRLNEVLRRWCRLENQVAGCQRTPPLWSGSEAKRRFPVVP